LLDANPAILFISFLVLLFSLTVHEAAHALTADRLGDPTARLLGRVSLNPAVHIDPIGTILLPLLAIVSGLPVIGWAKPVPVNGANLRNYRRDFVYIAAAGPASNVVLAIVASLVMRVADSPISFSGMDVGSPITLLLFTALQINVLLAVFNMVPVPPLDGGNVLAGLLPPNLARTFEMLRPYGFLVLYGLMFTGILNRIIFPPTLFLLRVLLP
jgi:Zn-dependent protease